MNQTEKRDEVLRATEAHNDARDSQVPEEIQKCKVALETAWFQYSGQKVTPPSPDEYSGDRLKLEHM